MNKADDLYQQGYFDLARTEYETALKSMPEDCNIVERLGFICFFKGQYQKGIECFQKVIRLDPSRKKPILEYMAFSCYHLRDYAGVVRILEEGGSSRLNIEQMRRLAKEKPYRIESRTDEAVIPFLRLDPLPIVEITVNSKKISVLIDTGGCQLYIDSDFARENNIIPLSHGAGRFAGGKTGAIAFGTVEAVSLGDIMMRNVPVRIQPTRRFGRGIDGVLGTEVLMQFLPTFDYASQKLILRLKNEKHIEKLRAMRTKAKVPFIIDRIHYMQAQCFINRRGPALMFFDSGLSDTHNLALILTGAALKDLQLIKPEMTNLGTGGGTEPVKYGYVEIDSVSVSDLVQEKLKAVYNGGETFYDGEEESLLAPAGYRFYGVISHNFLKHYAWTIDFENRWFLFDC